MMYIKQVALIFMMSLLVEGLVHAVEQGESEDPTVALVNGEHVLMSELVREMQAAMANNPGLQFDKAAYLKMRQDTLDFLINRELIVQEGVKAGLEPKEEEVDAEFEKIEQRFPSQSMFEQVLKQQKFTKKKLREFIKRGLIVRNVLEVKIKPMAKPVTEEDLADFYEANKEKFVEPEKVRASHILIKVSPEATDQEKADAKAKIEAILEKANNGSDFAELAKEYSQCPSSSQGGDLGYFVRGQMVKPFEDAAFSLQPGQISGIVKTRFGYHIIRVQDRKPRKQLKLEEVSEQIKSVLSDRELDIALRKWLKPIREKAEVSIMLAD